MNVGSEILCSVPMTFISLQCFDGLIGDGTCKCNNNFKGTACELCRRDDTFGLDCSKRK